MYKKILVPTDASDPARRALMVAVGLAQKLGSGILLLHVVFTPEAMGYTLSRGTSVPQEDWAGYGKDVALTAALAEIEAGDVPLEKKWLPGQPGAVILEEIERSHIDLVVMGSRGYGPLAGSLLGSVSQRVVSRAKCPVLIVR